MNTCIDTLRRLAGEYRAKEETRRNAERLRYWTLTGTWPDESARLAQTLAGWPRGHRGAWPRMKAATVAEVVSLVDRRRA